MAFIYREWRVMAASIFAVAAISGAYFLAKDAASPQIAEASTETALLQQIANKDSNGDGLPDWEKSLYGIPLNATTTDYFHLGMTDGEAVAKGLIVPVAQTPSATTSTQGTGDAAAAYGLTAPAPGSLTDTFAQNFFSLYISAEQNAGGSLTDDQINTIADQALTQLEGSVAPAPPFKTAAEISVSGTGPAAMRAYASAAEQVLVAHGVQLPESELQYLGDYLNTNDPTDLTDIQEIATSYQSIATGLSELTVPQEAAATHLEVVNALARIGEDATDFSNVNTDPLTAMLALQQYPQDVATLASAFNDVSTEFAAEGIQINAGASGSSFVNVSSNSQAQTTTP